MTAEVGQVVDLDAVVPQPRRREYGAWVLVTVGVAALVAGAAGAHVWDGSEANAQRAGEVSLWTSLAPGGFRGTGTASRVSAQDTLVVLNAGKLPLELIGLHGRLAGLRIDSRGEAREVGAGDRVQVDVAFDGTCPIPDLVDDVHLTATVRTSDHVTRSVDVLVDGSSNRWRALASACTGADGFSFTTVP